VALRVTMVIGEKNWSIVQFITPSLHYSITPHLLRYGAVMNFCRERSSGYLGKKTSTL
jgi:hypothetical protein